MGCLLLNMEVTQSFKTSEHTSPVTHYHVPDDLGPYIKVSLTIITKKYFQTVLYPGRLVQMFHKNILCQLKWTRKITIFVESSTSVTIPKLTK